MFSKKQSKQAKGVEKRNSQIKVRFNGTTIPRSKSKNTKKKNDLPQVNVRKHKLRKMKTSKDNTLLRKASSIVTSTLKRTPSLNKERQRAKSQFSDYSNSLRQNESIEHTIHSTVSRNSQTSRNSKSRTRKLNFTILRKNRAKKSSLENEEEFIEFGIKSEEETDFDNFKPEEESFVVENELFKPEEEDEEEEEEEEVIEETKELEEEEESVGRDPELTVTTAKEELDDYIEEGCLSLDLDRISKWTVYGQHTRILTKAKNSSRRKTEQRSYQHEVNQEGKEFDVFRRERARKETNRPKQTNSTYFFRGNNSTSPSFSRSLNSERAMKETLASGITYQFRGQSTQVPPNSTVQLETTEEDI